MKKVMLLVCLGLLCCLLSGAEKAGTLVLYFSWSDAGNTRQVAEIIAKSTGGVCEKIVPEQASSRKYAEVLKRGRAELKQSKSCPVKPLKNDWRKYDVIFVGSPIWFGTYAPPVRSFLQQNDLRGKKVFFFCTHGKGGAGTYFKDAKKLCPAAVPGAEFSCYGNHVKKIAPKVKTWVEKVMK